MAKINVVGDALVITSEIEMESLKLMESRNPGALVMKEKDEDGNRHEVFRISSGGAASLGKWGATFNSVSRDGGTKAAMTLCLPAGIKDPKAYVAETYGTALHKLHKIEKEVAKNVEEFNKLEKEIMDKVVVADEAAKDAE